MDRIIFKLLSSYLCIISISFFGCLLSNSTKKVDNHQELKQKMIDSCTRVLPTQDGKSYTCNTRPGEFDINQYICTQTDERERRACESQKTAQKEYEYKQWLIRFDGYKTCVADAANYCKALTGLSDISNTSDTSNKDRLCTCLQENNIDFDEKESGCSLKK